MWANSMRMEEGRETSSQKTINIIMHVWNKNKPPIEPQECLCSRAAPLHRKTMMSFRACSDRIRALWSWRSSHWECGRASSQTEKNSRPLLNCRPFNFSPLCWDSVFLTSLSHTLRMQPRPAFLIRKQEVAESLLQYPLRSPPQVLSNTSSEFLLNISRISAVNKHRHEQGTLQLRFRWDFSLHLVTASDHRTIELDAFLELHPAKKLLFTCQRRRLRKKQHKAIRWTWGLSFEAPTKQRSSSRHLLSSFGGFLGFQIQPTFIEVLTDYKCLRSIKLAESYHRSSDNSQNWQDINSLQISCGRWATQHLGYASCEYKHAITFDGITIL